MTRSNTRKSHRILVFALAVLVASAVQPWRLLAQAPSPAKGVKFAQISEADMKEWLTYLSSDELQGRQIYTEGYGLAAQYIADHLKAWGVKPIGDNGSYFQIVRMKGYRVANNSSITITGPDGTKTFKNGDHVTFPTNAGKVRYQGVETGVRFSASNKASVFANASFYRNRFADLHRRLVASPARLLENARHRFERIEGILRVLGPDATLRRGYSITMSERGKIVCTIAAVRPKMKIRTGVSHGEFGSETI